MAKNSKKKKLKGATAMDIFPETPANGAQEMDTSESIPIKPSLGVINRRLKKGRAMKRSKNLRKQKALERAISNGEKIEERAGKIKNKIQRVQSAKALYD